MNVFVIQGPNINMLGRREAETYGAMSMERIHTRMQEYAEKHGLKLDFFQSNSEGEIINAIQKAQDAYEYIIINPAAYTHTSIGIRDALLAVHIPVIEIHISNIYQREAFRAHSYISDIARGVISGFKDEGYIMALHYITTQKESEV